MVNQRITKPRKRSRSRPLASRKASRMSETRPMTPKKTKQPLLKAMEILKMWRRMLKKVVTRLKMSTTLQKQSLPDPRWANQMRRRWRQQLTQLPSPRFLRATTAWWIVYASSCTLTKSLSQSFADISSRSWASCLTNKRWLLLSTCSSIRKARFSMACCAILTNIQLPRSYRFSLSNRFKPRRRIGGKTRPSPKTAISIQTKKTRLN